MDAGVVFTTNAADRIAEAVRWSEAQRGQSRPRPAAPSVARGGYVARVTSSTPDGSGRYPAVLTAYSAQDAAWADYGTCKVQPANGETLASGARYPVWPGGTTGGGDQVYLTAPSGAAGSITVEAADGTPSYSGTTTLRFDEADGFSLSQVPYSTTVVVGLLPATYTQAGVVSTGWQQFAGVKLFSADYITVCSPAPLLDPNYQTGKVLLGGSTTNYVYGRSAAGADYAVGMHASSSAAKAMWVELQPYWGYVVLGADAGRQPTIHIYEDGVGYSDGQTATVSGLKFVGGVYVGGSFSGSSTITVGSTPVSGGGGGILYDNDGTAGAASRTGDLSLSGGTLGLDRGPVITEVISRAWMGL